MNTEEILLNLDKAIEELIVKDINILERGLNELNISGRLLNHLIPLFRGFDIDPEYNGDKTKQQDRKALDMGAFQNCPSSSILSYHLTAFCQ